MAALAMLSACASGKGSSDSGVSPVPVSETAVLTPAPFDADSAYAYVQRQVDFGPRVPNTPAHKAAGKWLASELARHGAKVTLQAATLTAFDGTRLDALNILGSYNPELTDRILLVAHWDTRPWADNDPNPVYHTKPVDGANDGASGVGVLLEIARQLGKAAPSVGVDILFVDAEDWGTYDNEESWALGSRHFALNPPAEFIPPRYGILLDMVGGQNATFLREQYSGYYAPELVDAIWNLGSSLGYGSRFVNKMGGAVTDDHVDFIRAGIPMIDIIEFDTSHGFNPRWHTVSDNMDGIDRESLGAVGTTVLTWLYNPQL